MKRKNSIIKILKLVFAINLLLTILIGSVSLFSWYKQSEQINYIFDDLYPKTKATLRLEGSVNLFVDNLRKFISLKNNLNRPILLKQLNNHIVDIEIEIYNLLYGVDKDVFLKSILELKKLIIKIDENIQNGFLIEQKKQEIITKIQWLHDDFNNELVALGQELSWQQMNVIKLDKMEKERVSVNLQNELQAISQLKSIEEQLKYEIEQFIYNINKGNGLDDYLRLKDIVERIGNNEDIYLEKTSLVTLYQTIRMLMEVVYSEDELSKLVGMINQYHIAVKEINTSQKNIIYSISKITNDVFNATKNKFDYLNNDLKVKIKIIGIIISISLITSILLMALFTYFYLHKSLSVRFKNLINVVELLNEGKDELDIKLDGKDEITEINFLLKNYTKVLKEKNKISQNLKQTQNELIQTAKLAIVGKTMTTLAHEINQPLNVLSIYIFSLKKLIEKRSYEHFSSYVNKIESQINRINRIIKGLRQFARNNTNSNMQLFAIKPIVFDAWELIEIQYKLKQSKLIIQGDANVFVDKGLLEQVFVNLFSNAFEACNDMVEVKVEILNKDQNIQVFVSDNGIGWPEEDSENLLSPFYTNKEIGLGLGLTICQRIMKQFNGNLILASNLARGAVVILEFNNTIGK
ncbi:hypothetical protein P375_04530 [Gallibacterium genomosp. 2]|uniref:histidine kinase n=1 Tax=Gallibacterium genomosp. 2 TaxID=155517 RepID=A0A0A2XQ78_9PAST|nr:ATP-binding protein [Gallibacterium genomosp. 2]KGQ32825.1 hypothetical protein P375_04530 [Gallibacterium genomosp. 2]